jgi:hypothetical protein
MVDTARPGIRTLRQRQADTRALLRSEVDAWVASADTRGVAYLVPLSFYWDGAQLVLATPENSRTARNLRRAGVARVALGPPRDVVMLDGALEFVPTADIAPELGGAHAAAVGFDPRTDAEPYVYILLTPQRVQAWRSAAELRGRTILRDGAWLATDD